MLKSTFPFESQKIARFQTLILDWYEVNQRNLPWRHTHDPYAILVSEVMLQQTQVERVLKYWSAWLKRWPNFDSLASTPTADIIRAWAGLGYNRRAVNLQRAARFITERDGFAGFKTMASLQTIPGIGPGTAGALMNFVWNIDTAFLEVNIKRIMQRLAFGPETIVGWAKDNELLAVAHAVLPRGKARIWPHALMDFGALACRPNDPLCKNCALGSILPASRLKHKNTWSILLKQSKPRFETTNRYWRGQIINHLRSVRNGLTDKQLFSRLSDSSNLLQKDRFRALVVALNKDGLLVIKETLIQLP